MALKKKVKRNRGTNKDPIIKETEFPETTAQCRVSVTIGCKPSHDFCSATYDITCESTLLEGETLDDALARVHGDVTRYVARTQDAVLRQQFEYMVSLKKTLKGRNA